MHLSFLWKSALVLCAVTLPFSPASAEENAPATPADAEEAAATKMQTLQGLLFSREARSEKEFADAAQKAREAGASAQQVLDAEVFRAAMQDTDADLNALAIRLEKALPAWNTNEAFSIRDATFGQALAHFLRAKAALQKDDEKTFQAQAALCIWANPQLAQLPLGAYQSYLDAKTDATPATDALDQAIATADDQQVQAAFTAALWSNTNPKAQQAVIQKITAYRDAQKMANLVLPLDIRFEQAQGEPVSFAELLKGKKAALLDFHASWCGPCMALLPELPKEAEKLDPHGVVVIAFNTQSLADAKKIREKFNFTLPVLAEKNNAFSGPLGVDSIPRYVLISAEGKILFNGHPAEKEKLAAALEKIGVQAEQK